MSNERPGGKTKEISNGEARAIVRDMFAGMQAGDGWDLMLGKFESLSAGNRRTVLEVMKAELAQRTVTANPLKLRQLVFASVVPGKSSKPDFVLGLVQTAFEVAGAFDAPGKLISSELLEELISPGARGEGTKLVAIPVSDLSKLARADAVVRALSDFLERARPETISGTHSAWGEIVGAAIAAKGGTCGLSPLAAQRALAAIATERGPFSPSLVLAVTWLAAIAGSVPDELRGRSPFSSMLSASSSQASNQEPVVRASRGPKDDLMEAIAHAVSAFESVGEQRRASLAEELAKRTAELSQSKMLVEQEEAKTRHLSTKMASLVAEISEMRRSLEDAERSATLAAEELQRWKKEVQVLHESRERQLDDARTDSRKEFVRSARSHLVNLRSFLADLKSEAGRGRMAATAYDEIIRVLQKQRFVSAEELPRLNEHESKTEP